MLAYVRLLNPHTIVLAYVHLTSPFVSKHVKPFLHVMEEHVGLAR